MTELQPVQLITWQGQKYSVKTQDYKARLQSSPFATNLRCSQCSLTVSTFWQVSELRKQAALLLGAPSERVQLLQQGKILQDGDDVGLAKPEGRSLCLQDLQGLHSVCLPLQENGHSAQ